MRTARPMVPFNARRSVAHAFTFATLTFALCTTVRAADPPVKSAPAKPAPADKILTPAQLRDCLAQQTKIKQQDEEAAKQKDALAAEKAEIARVGDALAIRLAALDRTDADAVNAYNAQAQVRDARIDAYEAAIDRYNARAESSNIDRDAFAKSCNNRRFLEDDESAIKKSK